MAMRRKNPHNFMISKAVANTAMFLDLPQSLPKLVQSRYNACKDASKVIFTPSELTILHTNSGLPFQLRYCPSLAKKPTAKDGQTKKSNPFENPDRDMVIADVPTSNPSHFLLLNKFPIIPNHFMLVTKENKPQNQKLEQGDIEATYACIQSWRECNTEDVERQLFGFFNSGEHSGASQAHRHVQFLPVESIQVESTGNDKPNKIWTLLMTRLSEGRDSVPFTYYWSPLPKDPSTTALYQIYTNLYYAAEAAVIEYIKRHPGELEVEDSEHASSGFSYNLGFTASEMFICPRRREGAALKNGEGVEVGFAALNGTLLAGSMMVKHQQEWECVKSRPGILDEILEAIGIPWPTAEDGSSAKI